MNSLLDWIEITGQCIIAKTSQTFFEDKADKKFFEVALTCEAILITGNSKHFPKGGIEDLTSHHYHGRASSDGCPFYLRFFFPVNGSIYSSIDIWSKM